MKLRVQSETVRQNIELFKKLVTQLPEEEISVLFNESYPVYIHKATGEMHFPALDFDSSHASKESYLNTSVWKAIEVRIHKHDQEEGVFEVAEDQTNWRCFRCDDLQPGAYRVLAETVKTLNFVSKKFQGNCELSDVILEVAALEVESLPEALEGKDIVHEAWYSVDRIEAEMLLRGQIEGTYLFRKDSFALVLEEQLKKNLNMPVKCVTLTFLEENGKVTDKTLIVKDGRWMIYEDDPNLQGEVYTSIYHLLEDVKDCLKMPLLN